MLLIALASILYGSVMAFTADRTRGCRSATRRSPSSASSRSGSSPCDADGADGALLQMVNHGLVVAPLFFIIALLAARAGGTEDLREMGGIAMRAPVLAALFLIVDAGHRWRCPGSANFIGEFYILIGVFQAKIVDRVRRLHRRRAGRRLRAAPLPPRDAQPRRPDGSSRAS